MIPKLYIHGSIDENSFSIFSKKLDKIILIEKPKKILIEVHSGGGEALSALAFFDKIRRVSGVESVHVTVTVYGESSSAAVLILAAGDKRIMSSNSWALIHEDSVGETSESMRIHDQEKEVLHNRRMENQWCEILASVTRTSFETWERLHKEETWLSAQECLALGLIEEVV